MEGFVTFPFCAGCGASLPQSEKAETNAWQRPVRATLLAAIIGVSLCALVIVGLNFLGVKENPSDNILVFGSSPAIVGVNEDFLVRITITREDTPDSSSMMYRDVAVRLPNNLPEKFQVQQFEPNYSQEYERERGLYYFFPTLSSPQMQLKLQARQVGTHKIDMRIYMGDELKGQYQKSIQVVENSPQKK